MGSESSARVPDAESAVAAATRRVAGVGRRVQAGGGGPRGVAAAPGCSTQALRQAAARAHLPAAAPGCVIGCPR